MRPRNSGLVLALLALAACDASVGNRTQRSGEVKVADFSETDENASEPLEGAGAPLAWRVVGDAAYYGAEGQPPVFALRCDRARQQILFERQGGGEAIVLTAGGVESTLEAAPAEDGRVQARAGLDDPVLDGMARPQAQIRIGGGPEVLTAPGGVAIRRVLSACRPPVAPEPATEEPGPIIIPPVITEPAPGTVPPPN